MRVHAPLSRARRQLLLLFAVSDFYEEINVQLWVIRWIRYRSRSALAANFYDSLQRVDAPRLGDV